MRVRPAGDGAPFERLRYAPPTSSRSCDLRFPHTKLIVRRPFLYTKLIVQVSALPQTCLS